MYVLKKANRIVEELSLEDGTVIEVNVSFDEISTRFLEKHNNILSYQAKIRELHLDKTGDITDQHAELVAGYGQAIIDLIGVIFGIENTVTILKYYDDKPSDMLENVMPWIQDVFMPRFMAILKQRRQQAAKQQRKNKR